MGDISLFMTKYADVCENYHLNPYYLFATILKSFRYFGIPSVLAER
jgi:hypothetical protein